MQLLFDRDRVNKSISEYLLKCRISIENDVIRTGILKVLGDPELFSKFVDIALLREICNIVDYFDKREDSILSGEFIFSNVSILGSNISNPNFKLTNNRNDAVLSARGFAISFNNSDELRKYLYDLVGFVYQSFKDGSSQISDPYVMNDFRKPKSIIDLCQNPEEALLIRTPEHNLKQKEK